MNELSEFIKTHLDEINLNKFSKVYKDAKRVVSFDDIGRLTDLFVDAEINPLLYVKNIPEYYMCRSSQTHIEIPENIVKIGNWAFYECTSLMSVTIPNSVTSIGREAFHCCDGLKSITISDSVTSIDQSAFQECRGLKSVIIGNSVKVIGWSAFQSCTGLTSVTMGNGVKLIDGYAFYNCLNLTTINFNGTIAQWNSIGKGISWIYNRTGNYTIHCIDGDLEE